MIKKPHVTILPPLQSAFAAVFMPLFQVLGRHARPLGWLLLGLVLLRVMYFAWVTEDAYITFRTVEHLWAGHGLRWNVEERVQSYTHPLWMLLLALSKAVSGDLFTNAVVLSLGLTAGTLGLVYRQARSPQVFALTTAILLLCQSFADYATSGLENPLSGFLGVLAVVLLWSTHPKRLLFFALTTALLFITRYDAMVMFVPVWLFLLYETWRKRSLGDFGQLTLGLMPALLWVAFSLFYYGLWAPNTAWAKINTGISTADLATQGLTYWVENLKFDPFATLSIAAGVVLLVRREARAALLCLGIALQMLYLVKVGGDYMLGRFLTTPLLVVYALANVSAPASWVRIHWTMPALLLAQTILSMTVFFQPVLNTRTGMSDERAYFARTNGFWVRLRGEAADPFKTYPWINQKDDYRATPSQRHISVRFNIGMSGYRDLDTYIVDRMALSDAFLAQHPMVDAHWRIGHFIRAVPPDYIQSVVQNRNLMTDAHDRAVLDDVWLASRGELWTAQRWAAIWRLNTGQTARRARRAFCGYPPALRRAPRALERDFANAQYWQTACPPG